MVQERKMLLSAAELAIMKMDMLRKDARNCSPLTPETAVKVAKLLIEARYDKKMTEKEYLEKTDLLKKETDRFKNNCSCVIKTITGKYD